MKSRKLFKLGLFLSSLILTALVLELGLRTYDLVRGYGFVRSNGSVSDQPIAFRGFGFDPYVVVDGRTMISPRGGDERFSLEKPNGVYRIVCFGGSTTEQSVNGYHYPGLLQEALRERTNANNVEVINVGWHAYSTAHSIILLALDVLSWNPDLIILSHNINDLEVVYWPGFRLDYGNKYAHLFSSHKRCSALDILWQYSRFYRFLYQRLKKIKLRTKNTSTIIRRSYGKIPPEQATGVFRRNLITFVSIAQSRGIKVILGTQPLEPSEDYFLRHMAYQLYNDIVIYPLHDEFVQHHAYYNSIIREVADKMGAGLVDNEHIFGGNREYFIDFVHYTEKGIRKLAVNYADAIIGKYLPITGSS